MGSGIWERLEAGKRRGKCYNYNIISKKIILKMFCWTVSNYMTLFSDITQEFGKK